LPREGALAAMIEDYLPLSWSDLPVHRWPI
jgi:hypothetical protein